MVESLSLFFFFLIIHRIILSSLLPAFYYMSVFVIKKQTTTTTRNLYLFLSFFCRVPPVLFSFSFVFYAVNDILLLHFLLQYTTKHATYYQTTTLRHFVNYHNNDERTYNKKERGHVIYIYCKNVDKIIPLTFLETIQCVIKISRCLFFSSTKTKFGTNSNCTSPPSFFLSFFFFSCCSCSFSVMELLLLLLSPWWWGCCEEEEEDVFVLIHPN